MERGHFEGLKASYRQTKDGMVISFVIHPNEDPGWLAKAPLGQRLQVAWAEIVDEQASAGGSSTKSAGAPNGQHGNPRPAATAEPPKRERSPAERAGFLCTLPEFQKWAYTHRLNDFDRDHWMEYGVEADACAAWLRLACGVSSRAHLSTDPDAHEAFCQIEEAFHRRNDPPPHTEPR